MRVFIISDMEGVSGIVRWGQVNGGAPMYEEGWRLYTEEINAAVRGARAGGATEIVVMDCHGAGGDWSFNSLIPERLDPDCEFVVQREWTEYTTPLKQGCDAALFVEGFVGAYHGHSPAAPIHRADETFAWLDGRQAARERQEEERAGVQ